LGAKLTIEMTTRRFYLLLGGTAYLAEGAAASQGFRGTENDQGLLGDAMLDPNAAIFPRGRLFGDRAFTGKVTTVYRFPSNVTIAAFRTPTLIQPPRTIRVGARLTF